MHAQRIVSLAGIFVLLMLAAGCSTRKNTAGSRFYHTLTTRYNVYFNGNEAYKEGLLAQQQGHKDNYMELLPLYPVGNKPTTSIGTSHFDRAIEKAQKAIRQHSIKRRPTRKPGKAYAAEYKKWLARREFNPYLHNVWMLMGKAQYQKGDFPEAAATFAYIARLYKGQTAITSEALIWLARTYTSLGWSYDAEDALSKVNTDSLPLSLHPSYAAATGNVLLSSQRYREAIPPLQKTAQHEKNKWQKARCYYLLGQIHQLQQQPVEAYQAYHQVIRLHPPYELMLNARIRQTEVMSAADSRKTAGKLLRISKEEKNQDYLDQIYYALGNVHLAQRDTLQAITAYHQGIEKSTRNGVEKGILQLTLGNLYWKQARYAEAQQAYTETIGLIEKTHREYPTIIHRSEILDELVPHTDMIQLQDSLQQLAALPEAARIAVIERIIAHVKRQPVTPITRLNTTLPTPLAGSSKNSNWYFYQPQTVEQGKAEFQRLWGKRKLEDNWRRKNKTTVSWEDFEKIDYNEPQETDSTTNKQADFQQSTEGIPESPATSASADSPVQDKHRPEFYLAQIPLTEAALEASNERLAEALFHAGILFKDRLQDLPRAEATLERLIRQFPHFAQLDEAYYYLFLTELAADYYNRHASSYLAKAEKYKAELLTRFPKSQYAQIIGHPEFMENAVQGRHREDSLYIHAYRCYQTGDFAAVHTAQQNSARTYPLGAHRPKFIFLDAVTQLQTGQTAGFLAALKELVRTYPENEITELAASILKGVQEGRLLSPESRPFGSIWQRRREDLTATEKSGSDSLRTDSLRTASFTARRDVPFLFLLAYEAEKIPEKQLLFEVARYNFTTFLVKNFDLALAHERGIGMLHVRPFANYDEAQQYFRQLYAQPAMAARLSGLRAVLISEANYELLLQHFSFDEYDAFFRQHFSSIPEPALKGYTLDEPLQNLPEEPATEPLEENSPGMDEEPENGVIFED